MKVKLLFIFLSFVLFVACSKEDTEYTAPQAEALQLNVSASNFVTDGAPDTRSEDYDAETFFEKGDRVGVIVLEGGDIKANNLPYVYDGVNWTFDSETANAENTGKSVYYYDNMVKNITYVVYYPYSAEANGVKDKAGLKEKFKPKADQQSAENYRASDLMVWTSDKLQKRLDVRLTHAYASACIIKQTRYTLKSTLLGVHETYIASTINNVAFIIDGKIYHPYMATDGSYRYILPADGLKAANVDCFYTYGDKTYKIVLEVPVSPVENTRYVYAQTVDAGTYEYNGIEKGDYYCITSRMKGFLIKSADKSNISAFGLTCLGVVFHVGAGPGDNIANYETESLKEIHGYVVALKDAHKDPGAWGIRTYWENDVTTSENLDGLPNYDGYKNTIAIRKNRKNLYDLTDINKDVLKNQRYWAFKVASVYKPTESSASLAAPKESSGWYLPSIKQLIDIAGYEGLPTLLTGAGGSDFVRTKDASRYWSSNQHHDNDTWYYQFDGSGDPPGTAAGKANGPGSCAKSNDGTPSDYLKNSKSYVRAVLTF